MTAGSSLLHPMYLFKGAAPVRKFAEQMSGVLQLGTRLVGSRFLREYP